MKRVPSSRRETQDVALSLPLGLLLITALFLARYLWVTKISWINDDFLFLERAEESTFLGNLSPSDAIGNAYRPLSRNFYFWFARRLLGLSPSIYHTLNLGLASLNILLFFLVQRRLLSTRGTIPQSGPASLTQPALVGTFLFSLHPVTATVVSWVSCIQDLLMVTFVLGATLAFLANRALLHITLLVLALLSKETAFFLPVVLWTLDVISGRLSAGEAARKQLIPGFILLIWLLANPFLPWNTSVQ
jgi:hypothetical protein